MGDCAPSKHVVSQLPVLWVRVLLQRLVNILCYCLAKARRAVADGVELAELGYGSLVWIGQGRAADFEGRGRATRSGITGRHGE